MPPFLESLIPPELDISPNDTRFIHQLKIAIRRYITAVTDRHSIWYLYLAYNFVENNQQEFEQNTPFLRAMRQSLFDMAQKMSLWLVLHLEYENLPTYSILTELLTNYKQRYEGLV